MNEDNGVNVTPLVSTKNLSVHFGLGRKLFGEQLVVRAVENISLDIPKGSFFGLVGESGSGKTTFGRAILKAAPITNGTITFNDGEVDYDIASLGKIDLKDYRKRALQDRAAESRLPYPLFTNQRGHMRILDPGHDRDERGPHGCLFRRSRHR